MKGKFLKLITVTMLLITLTMVNFIYVGAGLVSYAISGSETNHENVEFSAEIKNENVLSMQIGVKNEGYFNGEITLSDSNFKLKKTDSQDARIEGDKIVLNQVNAGTTIALDVEIEPVKEEIFNAGLLDVISKLTLTGTYKDQTEKETRIDSQKDVKYVLSENNNNDSLVNEASIITNKIVNVSGEEKRVVQVLLNMGLNENNYPIKEINLKLDPDTENAKVLDIARNVTLNTMTNYDFNVDGSNVELILKNEPNEQNNILWKKQGNENAVITLIYDKDTDVNGIVLNTEETVTLYNQKSLVATNRIVLDNEEKDEIIQLKATNTEESIFKGKLYSGIERTIIGETTIMVNLANTDEQINIVEGPAKYITPEGEADANVVYNQTTIKKADFDRIFGQDGQITIYNQNEEVIGTVSNSNEVDENQNIVINYEGIEPTSIRIETTTPVEEGNLKLSHTKTIKAGNRDIIRNSNELVTRINNNVEAKTRLEETTTEAKIEMDKNSLSTLTPNNVEIRATLKSARENNDLYKNPKLQIILPDEIEEIKLNNINKLYADEMQVTKAVLENGKVITIELEGEQSAYTSDISEGIQIVLNGEITFSKTTPSKQANIIMRYSNENGAQVNYETSKTFDIVSKFGSFVYSKVIDGEEITEATSNEELKVNLSATQEKEVIVERNIINNYETNMENVSLTGEIPELAKLEVIRTNIEGSKIYYSESENGQWQENISDISNAKAYKIEIPNNTLEPSQIATIAYKLGAPSNLGYNLKDDEELNVSYSHDGQNVSENYSIAFLTTTGVANSISTVTPLKQENITGIGNLSVTAVSAGEALTDGQEINEGQTVKVRLALTNTTGEDLENVRIVAKEDNAILYDYKVTQQTNTLTGENMNVTDYDEFEDVTQREFTAESLKAGETAEFEYEYSVAERPGNETKGTITINANNIETQTVETLTNPIKDADLKLKVLSGNNLEVKIIADDTMLVHLSAKNISNGDLQNVEVRIPLGDYIEDDINLFKDDGSITFDKVENGTAIFKINEIGSGETVDDYISFKVKNFDEKKVNIRLSAISTLGETSYISNELVREAYQVKAKLSAQQAGSIEGTTVKNGDKITYTTTIRNDSDEAQQIEISDIMQSEASIQSAYLLKADEQQNLVVDEEENEVNCDTEIEGHTEIKFVMEAEVFDEFSEDKELTNVVGIKADYQYLTSNAVTYIINNSVKEDEEEPDYPYEPDTPQNPDDPNNPDNPDIPDDPNTPDTPENPDDGSDSEIKSKGTISGIVWLDKDKNGIRDSGEERISNVEVRLLNTTDGKVVDKTTTDDNGNYKFEDIDAGKYIVALKYDTSKYSVTEYRKNGADEKVNSDVIAKEVNGERLAITDEIQVKGNVDNIDAGLTENKIFDLSLNKYVNKVTIQNADGTRVLQYNKEKLAKAEIHSKRINGSTVIVEYGIDVTNEGEIPGYANEIIDYLPDDFKFNSEMNKNWYTSTDKQLHSTSLSNSIINPGETKTITLVLTKTMSENNTGASLNTAEIAKSSNNLAVADKDSTAGNKQAREDDISEASVIISLGTGVGIIIAIIVSIMVIGLLVTTIIVLKKRGGINE